VGLIRRVMKPADLVQNAQSPSKMRIDMRILSLDGDVRDRDLVTAG
jgi:hypothetical protein